MKRKVSLLNAGKVFLAVVLMNIAIQFLASVILLLADIENGAPEFSAFNYIFMLVMFTKIDFIFESFKFVGRNITFNKFNCY